MSYFPMYIELENAKCLVIGGGNVAYRKVKVLQEFGAHVTVIGKEIDANIKMCQGKITCILAAINREVLAVSEGIIPLMDQKQVEESKAISVQDYQLVIAATDDVQLNHEIAELCKKKNVPVDAVDQQEDCTFIFPSYYKAGKLTMSLTTSGSSPYYAAKLREKLQNEIPDMTEEFLKQMSDVRVKIKECMEDSTERGRVLKQMVVYAMEHNRILTDEEITGFLENGKYE